MPSNWAHWQCSLGDAQVLHQLISERLPSFVALPEQRASGYRAEPLEQKVRLVCFGSERGNEDRVRLFVLNRVLNGISHLRPLRTIVAPLRSAGIFLTPISEISPVAPVLAHMCAACPTISDRY